MDIQSKEHYPRYEYSHSFFSRLQDVMQVITHPRMPSLNIIQWIEKTATWIEERAERKILEEKKRQQFARQEKGYLRVMKEKHQMLIYALLETRGAYVIPEKLLEQILSVPTEERRAFLDLVPEPFKQLAVDLYYREKRS
jgi:hypothetical protein